MKELSNREIRATYIVVIYCLIYFIGDVPNSIAPILYYLGINSKIYEIYIFFGNIALWFTHGSNLILYLCFNNEFKQTFKEIFRFKYKNGSNFQFKHSKY